MIAIGLSPFAAAPVPVLEYNREPAPSPIGQCETMVYQGTIQNGVVVFDNGIHLPEGTPVRVEPVKQDAATPAPVREDDDLLNMTKFAVDMGIPDLSTNTDHYLYGHPKVTDGE